MSHHEPGSFNPSLTDTKYPLDTKSGLSPDQSLATPASRDHDPHDPTHAPLLNHREQAFKFITTGRFWLILFMGQILSWCIVSTNTLTQLLANDGANIPAFQTLFNYFLLAIVYTPWTWYKYGFKRWFGVVWRDGWKYFILAFVDVQGVRSLLASGFCVGEADARFGGWC